MLYIFGWIVLSIAIGIWAGKWGRDEGGWFFLSLFISPLLIGLCLLACGRNEDKITSQGIKAGRLKVCKFCAETLKSEAIICKHCGKSCES